MHPHEFIYANLSDYIMINSMSPLEGALLIKIF